MSFPESYTTSGLWPLPAPYSSFSSLSEHKQTHFPELVRVCPFSFISCHSAYHIGLLAEPSICPAHPHSVHLSLSLPLVRQTDHNSQVSMLLSESVFRPTLNCHLLREAFPDNPAPHSNLTSSAPPPHTPFPLTLLLPQHLSPTSKEFLWSVCSLFPLLEHERHRTEVLFWNRCVLSA